MKHQTIAVIVALALLLCAAGAQPAAQAGFPGLALPPGTASSADDPNPPASPVKLAFVHHSVGDDWLGVDMGNLAAELGANNYYVSDTYYDWGPDEIGSYTDIGNWWDWFRGPRSAVYTQALYNTDNRHAEYTRPMPNPGGENTIILFKSCYPNSHLGGYPGEPPTTGNNPLRGEDADSEHHTVGNAKGIYNDILEYFRTRQDKLFIVITAPPLTDSESDAWHAANARALNNWLTHDWLAGYPHSNVAVFDFYNVLTSNGGDRYTHDLEWSSGNHHRWWQGAVQHIQTVANDFAAYGSEPGDSHPTTAGLQKAAQEFIYLLNIYYNRWKAVPGAPTPTATRTTHAATATATRTPRPDGTASSCPVRLYLPIILKGYWWPGAPLPSATPTAPASGCPNYPPGFTLVTDRGVYSAPAIPEPAPRQWFTDPVFGTCVVRVTDRWHDLSPEDPSTGMVNEYARVQSFNADGSRLLARSTDGTWYLYNAETLMPVGDLPLTVEPRWDATNPHLIFYSDETRLMSYNTQTTQQAQIRDFAGDFPGQSLSAVWTRHEGSPSSDRRYWGLMAQDEEWDTVAFVLYDRLADRVTVRDMRGVPGVLDGIDHVTMSPLGTHFLASFDRACPWGQLGSDTQPCGLMVYDRDLGNGRSLLRVIGHYDPALDAQGREVIVYQDIDTDHISMLDLASGAVTPLWEIDFSHTGIGLHFSGLAYDRPGWAVVSTHDEDAASHTWMDDQVFAIELRAGGRVVRLAHTQSITDETQPFEAHYWAEPHASTNADLTRVLFTTNWRRYDRPEVEMYMIALPATWSERLQ
jgi:hypothetical protein